MHAVPSPQIPLRVTSKRLSLDVLSGGKVYSLGQLGTPSAGVTANPDHKFKSALLEEIKRQSPLVPKGAKVINVDDEVIYLLTERPAAVLGISRGILGTFKAKDPQRSNIVAFSPLTAEEETALVLQSLPSPHPRKIDQMPTITLKELRTAGVSLDTTTARLFSPSVASSLLIDLSFSCLTAAVWGALPISIAYFASCLVFTGISAHVKTTTPTLAKRCMPICASAVTLIGLHFSLKLFVPPELMMVPEEAKLPLFAIASITSLVAVARLKNIKK